MTVFRFAESFLPFNSAFLANSLPAFAKLHPQIQIHVSPRPHAHPIIKGHYVNGREKVICVRNLEKEQVLRKAELLRDASGDKLRKIKAGKWVEGCSENVRGIWSGIHAMDREGGGPFDGISRKG